MWAAVAAGVALLVAVALVAIDYFSSNKGADQNQQAAAPGTPSQADAGATRTETITYDSWTVTCRVASGQPPRRACSGTAQLADKSNGRVLFAWIIGKDAKGTVTMVLQTPTGVQVLNGLDLKVGNTQPRRLGYTICDPQHCEAATAIDQALNKDLTSSAEAVVTILATDGRTINFTVPLKGIDKVIASL